MPQLIRLTEKGRCSEYCYSNGPKIKIAICPNDMPLFLQRTDIFGALCNFFFFFFFFLGGGGLLHNNSHCVYICRSTCSKWGVKLFGIIWSLRFEQRFVNSKIIFELWEWHIIRTYCNYFYLGAICITIVTSFKFFDQSAQMRYQNVWN